MAAQGVHGFFIHCRQGLKDPPYLSEQFMDRVGDAVAAAEQHGLIVHLYDEYPYPSGVAGGLVPLGQPQYHATELFQHSWELDGGALRLDLPAGRVLNVTAVPLPAGAPDWAQALDLTASTGVVLEEDSYQVTGLTRYNQKRYFSGKPHPVLQTQLPPGRWRVHAALQRIIDHNKYWGNFSDVLNPAAVQQFIAETHERYRRRFGDKFGSTIRWIFTDEVIPGWSASLPATFQREFGYDLLPLLPALKDPSHPQHAQVSRDLYDLKYRLFCQTFEQPISGWCRANRLAYAAEKPSLRFAQLRYQDIIGCEPGHTKAGARLDLLQPALRGNARATASAAYFYGKEGALDECYHSLGWSATLEDVRWMADAQLLLGIRYLVPHGFFYSTHNLRKHDAPPSLFFQAPYWPLYHHLSERVARIAAAFEGTWMDARLVLVDPTFSQPTPEHKADYERLLHGLMCAHIDFQVVDTDVLQAGQLSHGAVQLRDLSVRCVLLPPMPWLEPPLQAWLEQFERAGGLVLRLESNFDLSALLESLSRAIPPSLSLRSAGQENPALWSVCRRSVDSTAWLVLNLSGEPQTVELACAASLRELPLEPGASPRLVQQAGYTQRVFAPFEACLLQVVPQPAALQELPQLRAAISGPMEVRPLDANLVRLNDWQLTLLDEDGAELQSALVPAVPLANQLEQGRLRLAPRFERVFGTPPELALPPLRLRYSTHFQLETASPVELVIEPGSIVGDWTLRVNGAPLSARDLRLSPAHVRGSLGCEIAPLLRPGENTLTVELTTADPAGGLINPLYLAGSFGVALAPLRLVERPRSGAFEDYAANRLPFYAGELEYRLPVHFAALPAAPRLRLALDFPLPFHEACSLSLNGGPWHDLPWGPYELEINPAELRPGENDLRLKVYTTLIRSFEGQIFDYPNHRYISIE